MAILEEKVIVKWHGNNKHHYLGKGYPFTKFGEEFEVKVEDLGNSSSVKVTKICDCCGKIIPNQKCSKVLSQRGKDGKDRCHSCGIRYANQNNKNNIKYEKSLEFYTINNDKEYLLKEFSDKNTKKPDSIAPYNTDHWLWNCPDCGSEYYTSSSNRINMNSGCPYCSGRKVNHTNCLWTTNPEISKLLSNPERGYEITSGSNKRELFKCLNCGNEELKIVNNVSCCGFNCSCCSDGIKYPEKFISNILRQLNIKFKKEVQFEWSKNIIHDIKELSGNKRYDFYINELDCIIETHGEQHYKHITFGSENARGLLFQQKNDEIKENLAKENGIKHYIILDCRISNIDYIRNSLMESPLLSILGKYVDEIDWLECHKYATNSLVCEVCKSWENGMKLKDIVDLYLLSDTTVRKYLKIGSEIGICNYEITPINRCHSKQVVQLNNNGEVIGRWDSIVDASKETDTNKSSIWKVCNNQQNKANGCKWMYLEDFNKELGKLLNDEDINSQVLY